MNGQYAAPIVENTILSANHPSQRFHRSVVADSYSGYYPPYPELTPSSADTPGFYLRNTASPSVLTESHYRDMLSTTYYWAGDKLALSAQEGHPRFFYEDRDGSDKDDKVKKRRLPSVAQRRAANIRERRRMLNLNEAFDVLRRRVPTFNYERRLSRIETLRLAMGYISFMTQILNGKDPKDAKLNIIKPGVSVKMDKELQENVENAD